MKVGISCHLKCAIWILFKSLENVTQIAEASPIIRWSQVVWRAKPGYSRVPAIGKQNELIRNFIEIGELAAIKMEPASNDSGLQTITTIFIIHDLDYIYNQRWFFWNGFWNFLDSQIPSGGMAFSEATTVIRSCSHSSPGCQEWEPGPKGLGSDAPPNTWSSMDLSSLKEQLMRVRCAFSKKRCKARSLGLCVFAPLLSTFQCTHRGKYTKLRHLHQRCVAHGLACSRKRPLRLVTSTNCWAARHMKSKSPSDPWKGKVAKNTFRNSEKNCRLIQALDGFKQ